MEADKRCFFIEADHGLSDALELSCAALGVFGETSSFVALVDDNIANTASPLVFQNTDPGGLLFQKIHFLSVPFLELGTHHAKRKVVRP